MAGTHADDWQPPLDDALRQAADRHAPILVEFHAPWCYSCYYMERNVLNGAEWDQVAHRAVVVDLDADSPEGSYWKQRLSVQGLPAYVVLNEQGAELGRINYEQTRSEFYHRLDGLLSRSSSLDDLRAKVRDTLPSSLRAAREVLRAYHERGDSDGGMAWVGGLPAPVQQALDRDAHASLWIARLKFLKAVQNKNAAQCAALVPPVLAGDLDCDRAYELDRALSCTVTLPPGQRADLFARQKPVMTRLLYARVFVTHPTCADARSEVLATADLDRALGYDSAEADILARAILDTGQRLDDSYTGPLDIKPRELHKNRNLADNLRVFLEKSGKANELDLLYPKLIAAYPDDYVYAYRFAKSLAARGQNKQALLYLQEAAPKAYGINRLNVAQLQAQVLLKLDRGDEARQVVADALKANGPWFPDEAAKLRSLVVDNTQK